MKRKLFPIITACITAVVTVPPYLFGVISGREAVIAFIYAVTAIVIYDMVFTAAMRGFVGKHPNLRKEMKEAIKS